MELLRILMEGVFESKIIETKPKCADAPEFNSFPFYDICFGKKGANLVSAETGKLVEDLQNHQCFAELTGKCNKRPERFLTDL